MRRQRDATANPPAVAAAQLGADLADIPTLAPRLQRRIAADRVRAIAAQAGDDQAAILGDLTEPPWRWFEVADQSASVLPVDIRWISIVYRLCENI